MEVATGGDSFAEFPTYEDFLNSQVFNVLDSRNSFSILIFNLSYILDHTDGSVLSGG